MGNSNNKSLHPAPSCIQVCISFHATWLKRHVQRFFAEKADASIEPNLLKFTNLVVSTNLGWGEVG